MRSKKDIKREKELAKKKAKRKEIRNLIIGGLIFLFAIAQAVMIIIQLFEEPEHNKIMLGNSVVTTEVCTQWYNYTPEYQQALENFYYEDGFNQHKIPTKVVKEVCPKWKVIKDEFDKTYKETKP